MNSSLLYFILKKNAFRYMERDTAKSRVASGTCCVKVALSVCGEEMV